MTPTLLLMRHGKSDWSARYDHDADRPLNHRGRRAARLMGWFLTSSGHRPDLTVTSPARRARDTLALTYKAGRWDCPTTVADCLYEQNPADLVRHLRREVPHQAEVVLVVGHETTWSEAIELLTGAQVRLPTAAVACIELAARGWDEVTAGSGRLAWMVPPKLIGPPLVELATADEAERSALALDR